MTTYTFTVTHQAKLVEPSKFVLTEKDYHKVPSQKCTIMTTDDKIQIQINKEMNKGRQAYVINGNLMSNEEARKKDGLVGFDNSLNRIVKAYNIDTPTKGKFIIYNTMAELTIYGAGRPIKTSQIGYLTKLT